MFFFSVLFIYILVIATPSDPLSHSSSSLGPQTSPGLSESSPSKALPGQLLLYIARGLGLTCVCSWLVVQSLGAPWRLGKLRLLVFLWGCSPLQLLQYFP